MTLKLSRMTGAHHILLLAGSFEARRAAEALSARGHRYDAWVSQAPRGPAPLPQVPRLCRFTDAQAMQSAMHAAGFTAVLDASHAFDRSVTAQAYAAAIALDLPYLRLERPVWNADENPGWHNAPDCAAASARVPAGTRVFCATGWDSVADYAGFRGEVLLLRQTRRHARPAPAPFVQLVFGDPPFAQSDEEKLFRDLRVDMLICRNLGGRASRPKVDAAAALGLGVVLIDRPQMPQGAPCVAELDAALDWVEHLP